MLNIFKKFFSTDKKPKTSNNTTKYQADLNNTVTSNLTITDYESREIEKILTVELSNGLLPGEIILLQWLHNKQTNIQTPQYFLHSYGIKTNQSIEKLISNQFLRLSTPYETLQSLKVKEIKAILINCDLKVTGKKQEMIDQIRECINEIELESQLTYCSYVLTEKGNLTLEEYDYILWACQNSSRDGIISVSSIIKAKQTSNIKLSTPDLAWGLLQKAYINYLKEKHFGLATNTVLNMAQHTYNEKRYKDSLLHYIRVFINDISGLSNNNLINMPNLIFVAPGNIKIERELIEVLKFSVEDLQAFFYHVWENTITSLPFHYLDKDVCFKCFMYSLKDDIDLKQKEDLIQKEIQKSYNKLPNNVKSKIMNFKPIS